MITKPTDSSYTVPVNLQKMFIAALLLMPLAQLAFFAWQIFRQLHSNADYSGYYMFLLNIVVLPLLFVVLAYVLNPRTLRMLPRIFESMLIAIIGTSMYQIAIELAPGQ